MKFTSFLHRLMLVLAVSLVPLKAHANGTDIQNIFLNLISSFSGPILVVVAILVVVTAGFTLLVSEQEGAIDKAKKTIIGVMVGGIIVTIILFFPGGPRGAISILYNGLSGTIFINNGATLGLEAEGVSGWLTAMAAMIGIVIIIISVIRAVASFGGDEAAYTNVRTCILHVIIGLIIIGGAFIFKNVFFLNREPSALILLISSKIILLRSFILLIAVAILIYAGLRMVTSFGREEDFTAARGLAVRVVIGIIIILLSYSLVFIVSKIFG